jgi:hypothetical protein
MHEIIQFTITLCHKKMVSHVKICLKALFGLLQLERHPKNHWSDNVRWEIRKTKHNITLRRTKEVTGGFEVHLNLNS